MSTQTNSQPGGRTQLLSRLNHTETKLDEHPAKESQPSRPVYVDHELKHISLVESESRYRRLFEAAKDGILILDGDTGRITDVNPFLQEMLDYSKSELVGKTLWEIGPVKDIAASHDAMQQLQKSEYIRYENLPLETKTGQRKQVEFVSNVYLVDGWRMIQCNIRDITERKRAEIEEQKNNEQLAALMDELQWRDRQMQLLNHLSELLQSCTTQAEAYQVINLTAGDLFPGYDGCLAILHTGDDHLEMVAQWGAETIIPSIFALDDCWALRRGQMYQTVNPQADLLCNHFTHAPQNGYLCLPLTVQGETLGSLCVIDKTDRKGFQQMRLEQLAVTVGETLKLSLTNLKLREKLRQQTIHDSLTGLFNRNYLDATLPRELYQAQRRNSPLCIALLDFDHYQDFNDAYGQGAGDLLLREFGRVLREHLRKSDISCRYGDDEFALVLPDTTLADTQARVEQIRALLKGLRAHYGEEMLSRITLSAGIVQTSKHGITVQELLRTAHEALNSAKQSGRDHTAMYKARGSEILLPQVD